MLLTIQYLLVKNNVYFRIFDRLYMFGLRVTLTMG